MNKRMINAEYSADITVTSDEIAMAIRKLCTGKSSGPNGFYAEHLLHCSQRFITMLAMYRTISTSECYIQGCRNYSIE